MSHCQTHIRRINPSTGTSVVYDVNTGAVVTDPAILAQLGCCPERHPDKEKVCLIPNGQTDAALIVPGWLVTVVEVAADGTPTVVSSAKYDAEMANDLTATHEVTECLVDTPIDVPLCLPA